MLRDPSTHVARSTGPARLSIRARSVTCFASHVDLTSGQLCVDVWVSGSCQSSFWLCEASPVLVKAWTDKVVKFARYFVCGCQPFFLVSFCSNSVSLKACQLSGVPQKAKPCVVVAGDGKIFACGQEEVFPCWRRGTYLASWPNVALAGAFHADGQRDRDDGDRGKST